MMDVFGNAGTVQDHDRNPQNRERDEDSENTAQDCSRLANTKLGLRFGLGPRQTMDVSGAGSGMRKRAEKRGGKGRPEGRGREEGRK